MEEYTIAVMLGALGGILLDRWWTSWIWRERERDAYERGRDSRNAEVQLLDEQVEGALTLQRETMAELRAVYARLTEHRVRVERHEAGMPEIEAGPRPQPHPMSKELREWINGFKQAASRETVTERALGLLRHMPADKVLAQLQQEAGESAS